MVEWKPGYDGGYIQTFFVYYKGIEHEVKSSPTNGSPYSFKCKNLKPRSTYEIVLCAKNIKGNADSCILKDCETKGKPDPPTEFRIANDGITDTSIEVEWEPGYDGGYSQTFYVYYNGEEHEVKSLPTNGSPYSFKCEKLKPRSSYEIVLNAKNIKGNAESCILKGCETKGKPDPPKNFRIANDGITDTIIEVEWEPGYDGGYEQTFYVYYNGEEHEVISPFINGSF
ncbi:protein sidekick-1-like [Ruditapes philippinarum]|uniref:protein sidekick-1-like n=1 Tax=Ruditapes philippinarum TaxID=129788 RepID=UPI00295BDEF3|nr:protein sidekick-1-like [Ruditapes philippinarum]